MEANLVLGFDLFLQIDDKVTLDGGFQISIPDNETLSLLITVDLASLDPLEFNATAGILEA